MALVRAEVRVTGRVQGVWFRQSTKNMADQHGVTGWCRNNPDGSVEAVFEGKKIALKVPLTGVKPAPDLPGWTISILCGKHQPASLTIFRYSDRSAAIEAGNTFYSIKYGSPPITRKAKQHPVNLSLLNQLHQERQKVNRFG